MSKDAKGHSIAVVYHAEKGKAWDERRIDELDVSQVMYIRFYLNDKKDNYIDVYLDKEETDGVFILGVRPISIHPHASNDASITTSWLRRGEDD